jgi:hypothetical protein
VLPARLPYFYLLRLYYSLHNMALLQAFSDKTSLYAHPLSTSSRPPKGDLAYNGGERIANTRVSSFHVSQTARDLHTLWVLRVQSIMERMMITVIVEMRANPTRGLFRKSQEAMILARVQRKRNVATNQGQAKPINQNKSPVL